MSGRSSFVLESSRAIWTGSRATLDTSTSLGRSAVISTVLPAATYIECLSFLPLLPRRGYEFISITGFLSLGFCVIGSADQSKGPQASYVGDNQNVVAGGRLRPPVTARLNNLHGSPTGSKTSAIFPLRACMGQPCAANSKNLPTIDIASAMAYAEGHGYEFPDVRNCASLVPLGSR